MRAHIKHTLMEEICSNLQVNTMLATVYLTLSSSSCCILSLQYYDAVDKEAQAISILFKYTDSDVTGDETPSHAVAQLPIEAMVGLPMETVPLCDLTTAITK